MFIRDSELTRAGPVRGKAGRSGILIDPLVRTGASPGVATVDVIGEKGVLIMVETTG
jgi:hypothetical protein